MPEGTEYVANSAKIVNGDNSEEEISIEDLAKGISLDINAKETKKISFTVKVKDMNNDTVIRNVAKVNDKPTQEVEHTYVKPEITSRKEVTTEKGNEYAVPGEKLTYKITVENAGSLEKEITIQDTISDKLDLLENSIKLQVNGKEVTDRKLEKSDIENGFKVTVPAKDEESLAGKVELIFEVRVKEKATGTVANKAIVDGKETEEVKNPIIRFEKTAEIIRKADEKLNIPEDKVTANDEIIYKVKVTNSGDMAAENISVRDSIPEGTQLKPNTVSDNGKVTNNTETLTEDITWEIASLAPGETKELSFTVIVTQNKEDKAIKNTAYVAGDPTNETTTEVQLLSKLTVRYIEKATGKEIARTKVETLKVGDTYKEEPLEIEDYSFIESTDNTQGTIGINPEEVIFYYEKNIAKIVVHHYEEGTTNKLSENVEIDGHIGDTYNTKPATDIPSKYELVAMPENASGTMTKELEEIIYYYRVKDTSLIIKYLEKDTNKELAKQERQTGKVEEDYITEAKQIEGYTLVGDSGNKAGTLTIEPITVIFYYLQNTKVTVNHIDKNTGEILEKIEEGGLVGDKYTSTSKNFNGYILVEKPKVESVTMTKDEIVLNYYYVQISAGVIEKHIDIITGEILDNDTHEGNVGDPYNIPSKEFKGYDLVEERLPQNAKGIMAVNETEVIYYYIYRSNVTAEYIDKITGKKLLPDEKQDGHEGDNYTTERKPIDDYVLIEVPENADGTMTKDPIVVKYYYVHTTAGVIERHIDIKTGEQLVVEQKFEGYEGDDYKTEPENIPYYDLVKEKYPENAEGKMTIEQIVVNYYYIRKTDVVVKYIDKVTGKEIIPEEIINGHEGDEYNTETKEISGYDLVEVPENKDGIMTKDTTTVIYEYIRPAKVIVNYIDIDTNKELASAVTINGHQEEKYETEEKDIKFYKLVEERRPVNATGKMNVEVTKDENGNEIVNDTTYVNYYYRKLNFNLSIDKKVNNIVVNGKALSINGKLGKVEIAKKDISTSKIEISYIIKVTNKGELAGKATILENIPFGTTMTKEQNPMWNIANTVATLDTDEIKPGETREYEVILVWNNNEDNIGTKLNEVEILSNENEPGFEDSNKDDDKDKAEVIISISTGGATHIAIAGVILVILAGTVVVLVKKTKEE